MIQEIRIISENGISLSNVPVSIGNTDRTRKEQDSNERNLYAGMISAILSMSQELENELINEIVYKEHKIYIYPDTGLLFLGISDIKVPNSDIEALLKYTAKQFLSEFTEDDFLMASPAMQERAVEIVRHAVDHEFWWANPDFNLENNTLLFKDVLLNPSKTYFVSFLPNIYVITALIPLLLTLGSTYIFGAQFVGLYSDRCIDGQSPEFWITSVSLLASWLGIGLLMKAMSGSRFSVTNFLIISGIFTLLLIPMIGFLGAVYVENIVLPILNNIDQSPHY